MSSFRRRQMLAAAIIGQRLDYDALAIFDVASTESPTRILGSDSLVLYGSITSISIDGVPITPSDTYTFATTGLHEVKYTLQDKTTIPDSMFGSSSGAKRLHDLREVSFAPTVTNFAAFSFIGSTYDYGHFVLNWPERISTIGQQAFRWCKGLDITEIPETVISIGQYCFDSVTGLSYLHIKPSTPPTIGAGVFSGSYKLYVGDGSSEAYDNAILATYLADSSWSAYSSRLDTWYHYITYITFADPNVEAICVQHWSSDGIRLSYADAAAVTQISQSLFANNTTITSFEELQYFTGLSGGDALLPYAFYGCSSLARVALPNTLARLSAHCFNSSGLTGNIVIPASVNYISGAVFWNTQLTSCTVLATTPPTLEMSFLPSSVTAIYVPAGSVAAYKAAANWSDYESIIQAIPNS